ncbi:MAG: SH3 domain-containing protein [Lewinellaceae bacterium]|nr:SH3 domain-containing protein [Saprospiraceae bacterium]MCB9330987.1 SH3 domain-containing protein [Lewinellaceae bacterium]
MRTLLPIFILSLLSVSAITLSAQTGFFPDNLVVSASALNLRDQPNKSGKVLEKLARGSSLKYLATANDGAFETLDDNYGAWLKVQSGTGKTGFVFSSFVTGLYNLYLEGETIFDQLPEQHWYGVYARDSFSDELRAIKVQLATEYNSFREEDTQVLRTNQSGKAKFIIGTTIRLQPGPAGDLGIFEPAEFYFNNALAPGAMLALSPGAKSDDTPTPSYYLAASGCARLKEDLTMALENYKLTVLAPQDGLPTIRQDLSPWFRTTPGVNHNVRLRWFGDIDGDARPDAIIEDMPEEMGMRISLFLTSKARDGELLRKVCEYWPPLD